MRRIAVTGLGVVSPVGVGVERFWDSIVHGRSGAEPIEDFDVSGYPTRFAALASDFDHSAVIDPKEARRMSRFIRFAIVAADEALRMSGLEIDDPEGRVGVIYGSGIGGLESMEEQHKRLMDSGVRRVSPFLVPMMIADLAAGHISIRTGAKGVNYCPVSACATGNHSIGEAFEAIRRGDADVVIAGSSDASVTPLGLAGFCAARALSTRNDEPRRASRPFDRDRDGFVMGEGAGAVILEAWEHAQARGADVICELAGYGATADAYHITAPAPGGDGAVRAMRAALDQAGLEPSDIGYINAHGTSTEAGDAIEALSIREVFGERTPPVSSTKSVTGHMLGGAGSVEFVAMALALTRGLLPPTANLDDPDPECRLEHIRGEALEARVDSALSNSFGFGGHNATLAVKAVR